MAFLLCSDRIFEDPQCLDCKHNFCRECIFVHLRKHESKCPTCSIPIFPSEIMRNQFLQSILAAWKVVELELALLEANGAELRISIADTDRALGGAGGSCASPPASHAAASSTGAAIAAALVNTPVLGTPSRGPVGKSKWNVDTAAIRNEPKAPKQRTGVAQSPIRAPPLSRTESNTPGLTQLTQMTPVSNGTATNRRRNLFSPAAVGGESESLTVMPTQELEGYLARIQMQKQALSQWEEQIQFESGSRHAQSLSQKPQSVGTSAMEKLIQKWVASGSSQTDGKPAAHDSSDDDADKDDEDDESQTQMLAGGYTDSPDLLAAGANALLRSGLGSDSRRRRSTLQVSKRSDASAKRPRTAQDDERDDDDEAVEDSQLRLDSETVYHRRHKHQRVSDDFAGAISAFHAKRPGVQSHQRPAPVAHMDALAAFARPPLAGSARQLAAAIRKSSSFTLIATDLTASECKRVSTACALLGGRFGLSFDLRPDPVTGVLCSSVTHLIAKAVPLTATVASDAADGRRCKRTAKYMRALAEGSLVVDYAWVEASLEAGRWLNEEPFEMVGDAYSRSVGKPRESYERRQRTGQRHDLFQHFRFVLLCNEQEFDYQVDTLSGVVENFGGSVISSAHFARLSPVRRARKTHVGLVGRATAPADAQAQWRQHQIPIVRVPWLFECISNLEIVPYEDFYPYL